MMSEVVDDPPKKRLKQSSITDVLKEPSTEVTSEDKSCADKEEEQVKAVNTTNSEAEMAHAEPTPEEIEQIEPTSEEMEQIEPTSEELEQLEPNPEEMEQVEPPSEPAESANGLNCSNQDEEADKAESEEKPIKLKPPKILGKLISELKREPDCSVELGELKSSSSHTVLVDVNLEASDFPKPSPEEYTDKWHKDYVRLPCSSENSYTVSNEKTKKGQQSRWELLEKSLSAEIRCSTHLVQAILAYNARFNLQWDFSTLVTYIDKVMTSAERKDFFDSTLPAMVKLALELPKLCTQGIPLLRSGIDHSVTFSQKQVASLLANAFFCTFPRRCSNHKNSEYGNYPSINFITLFSTNDKHGKTLEKLKFEKFKCLFNYFKRIAAKENCGLITFHRKCMKKFPLWKNCHEKLSDVHFSSQGLIEHQDGLLQVDFANKFVGGGIFRRGCVQEEIFYLLCPELIVSRLFTESLEKNEVLVVTGCERFNETTGYSKTFKWVSDYVDDTLPRDKWARCNRKIVAINASHFPSKNSTVQYTPESIFHELDKALVGFSEPGVASEHIPAVATGNWGCGAFNGDPRLKFLIQLMAASRSQRDVAYFTFNDPELCQDLFDMYSLLKSKQYTVGHITSLFTEYHMKVGSSISSDRKKKPGCSLYNFIYNKFIYDDFSIDTEFRHQQQKREKLKTTDKDKNEKNVEAKSTPAVTTDENVPEKQDGNEEKNLKKKLSEDSGDGGDEEVWMEKLYGSS